MASHDTLTNPRQPYGPIYQLYTVTKTPMLEEFKALNPKLGFPNFLEGLRSKRLSEGEAWPWCKGFRALAIRVLGVP